MSSRLPFKIPLTRTKVWHHVDASEHSVGRLASRIASILQGKHKPIYNPSVDCGDWVVVTNAEKVVFTGDKWEQKFYRWHTMYPGGLKSVRAKNMLRRKPDDILWRAVSGMLPKNGLRKQRLGRMRVYVGEDHPHVQNLVSSELRAEFVNGRQWNEQKRLSTKALEQRKVMEEIGPEAFAKKYGAIRVQEIPDGELPILHTVTDVIEGTHEWDGTPDGRKPRRSSREKRQEKYKRIEELLAKVEANKKKKALKRKPFKET